MSAASPKLADTGRGTVALPHYILHLYGPAMSTEPHGDLAIVGVNATEDGRTATEYVEMAPTADAAIEQVMTLLGGTLTLDANSGNNCPGDEWAFPDNAASDNSEPFNVAVNNVDSDTLAITGHVSFWAEHQHQNGCCCNSECWSNQWTFTFEPTSDSEQQTYAQWVSSRCWRAGVSPARSLRRARLRRRRRICSGCRSSARP